ncbi:hypothetical protein ABZ879_22530, partial [Streptomyces chartreusis]
RAARRQWHCWTRRPWRPYGAGRGCGHPAGAPQRRPPPGARPPRRPPPPGLRHATASGFASGVASALTQTVTVAATDHSAPLLSLQVVGVALLVAAFAASGLLLSQTAYRGGLGAPLAVVTLANPLAAAVIGLVLLGERLQGGPTGILLALAGAGLASWGVVLLSRATPKPAESGVSIVVASNTPDTTGLAAPQLGTTALAANPVAATGPAGNDRVPGDPAARVGAPPDPAADEDHPVAAVLALGPGSAATEPALVPRQPGPGHLTAL